MTKLEKQALEEIDLEGWTLVEEQAAKKVYQKNGVQKHLSIYDTYSLEEHFVKGQLEGLTIGRMHKPFTHYPNQQSKIYLFTPYKHGLEHGKAYDFYEGGARVETQWEQGKVHGKQITFYPNGQKEKEASFVHGQKEGKQFEWYANGQLKIEESYSQGKAQGEYTKYLEDGLIKRKQSFLKGKVEGIVYELWINRAFSPKQQKIYSETPYKNGLPHGLEIVYFPDGTKMREGRYHQGLEEGERTWWNEQGKLSIKENYTKGELDGKRFLYDDHGQLESIQLYRDGERIS
ncbi:MAG: toxin-antitoxin system YwqK family antitoxin [Bacteroidota bacterium]